jgi:hypothetical protein
MSALNTPLSYHRVNKIPLDDSEVFTSMANLMTYCKSGAWYNGQRVAVNFKYYTQTYTIRNGTPIIDLPNGNEWVVRTEGSDKYVMVYYHNTDEVYSISDKFSDVSNPFKFIFMDSIAAFEDSGYSFILEVGSTKHSWTQQNNPIDEQVTITKNGTSVNKISKAPSSTNGYIETNVSNIFLMPRSTNSNIMRLYVKATKYLKEVM